jgi:hypothetical protein
MGGVILGAFPAKQGLNAPSVVYNNTLILWAGLAVARQGLVHVAVHGIAASATFVHVIAG